MLYDHWRQVASVCGNEVALLEVAHGRRWTFCELACEAERQPRSDDPIVCPVGVSVQFVVDVLRAWRVGQVVCPLEMGQVPPRLAKPLPSGIAHLNTTSASTGMPRLVAYTAHQLLADARNIVATMGLRPE